MRQCLARVIGPSLASAVSHIRLNSESRVADRKLFAISMDGKVLGGNLWWIAMCIFASINFLACLSVAPETPLTRRRSVEQEELEDA